MSPDAENTSRPIRIPKLVYHPDPQLRMVSRPVAEVTDDTRRLVKTMAMALYAHRGAGISAVQIGVLERIFVVNPLAVSGQPPLDGRNRAVLVFINPEILERRGAAEKASEGCLSLPGMYVQVARHPEVTVRAMNEYGTTFELATDGLQARVIQHEYDHLDGKLIFDNVSRLARSMALKKYNKQRAKAQRS